MSSTGPSQSTNQPGSSPTRGVTPTPTPQGGGPSSESSGTAEQRSQENKTSSELAGPIHERPRHDHFSRVLAQIGYRRLKRLMHEASEELMAVQSRGNGGSDGVRDEEVLTKVVEMLKEAEHISDTLNRELVNAPATASEQETLAARVETLELERRVGQSQRKHWS